MWDNPVKQHTVPCSYLQWFCDKINSRDSRDSKITQYIVKQDKVIPEIKISNCSIIKDFYTFIDKDWNLNYEIENWFWIDIESINHIIKKINDKIKLNDNELANISVFIWFQSFRTAWSNDWIWLNKELFLTQLWEGAKMISDIIIWSNLYIFNNNKWNYITSNYCMKLIKSKTYKYLPTMWLWLWNSDIWFPLSKNSYLYILQKNKYQYTLRTNNQIEYIDDNYDLYKIFNQYSYSNKSNELYWKNKEIMDNVTLWKDKNNVTIQRKLDEILSFY